MRHPLPVGLVGEQDGLVNHFKGLRFTLEFEECTSHYSAQYSLNII